MSYLASQQRYASMQYRRCGASGIKLPLLSLGLWHNFGGVTLYETAREMVQAAFDLGITHFDLANNYGPPPGSAEKNFGRIIAQDFRAYRDEMIVSTKAGYTMWDGPYGDFGSRKYLISSLDQSLKRMNLDYVDIFYHHRMDPETPLEETMSALDHVVRQGKALYVGISNYGPEETRKAAKILKELGTPCLIHQPKYSMLHRIPETGGLLKVLDQEGIGSIVFSPLAQGLLTGKYLDGVPEDSRAAGGSNFLTRDQITPQLQAKLRRLNELAKQRGQSLSQMAIAWVLRDQRAGAGGQVTTVLIGASRVSQIAENVEALKRLDFNTQELQEIDSILESTARETKGGTFAVSLA